MDDRELAKLLTQAGEDPNAFVGTSSQMNADGTVTVTGRRGSVTAIAQTAFRSGAWSVKRVGGIWYAWSTNSPSVEAESRQVRRSPPIKKPTPKGRFVILFDTNLADYAQNHLFLENLLYRLFSSSPPQTIYTFSDDPGEGIPPKSKFSAANTNKMIDFFKDRVEVEEVNVSQLGKVKSLFYWAAVDIVEPNTTNPFVGISKSTIKKITEIAQKYGVILQGENQDFYNPANHYLMDKFYKPSHKDYSFTFSDGERYNPLFQPYLPYENKYSKILFKDVQSVVVASLTAGIPMDVIPENERLAIFNYQSKDYVGALGWGLK